VADEKKRQDCYVIIKLMKQITRSEPKMWGPSIIGFGSYHYKYDSGHEGDSSLVGFSPRKQNITLYLMGGFRTQPELLKKLGKYKTGGGCLYINNLDDVNIEILRKVIKLSIDSMKQKIETMKKKNK
jgi:hypothetical protein